MVKFPLNLIIDTYWFVEILKICKFNSTFNIFKTFYINILALWKKNDRWRAHFLQENTLHHNKLDWMKMCNWFENVFLYRYRSRK